ncbi:helix-turn-helix domain-containing protein [Streptomyces sp. RK9]|uniref:helix-turn-helix domain-containing protein n=1 Tax=Streptomyces sp. RK9 TaxID=3239284 RepID=UPI0038633B11
MGQVEMASLAELLREFKERSGLSYGVLAKRLQMSTSTLHRYCNGDAVPTDFGPVERFARLCGATPEELVEVHRRWILADADRGRKTEPPAAGAPAPAPKKEPEPTPQPEPQPTKEPEPKAEPPQKPEAEPQPEPVPSPSPPAPSPPPSPARRRRRTLVLAASVAAVLGIGSAAVLMNGGDDDDKGPAAGRARGADSGAPLTARTEPYAYEDGCAPSFLVNRKPDEVPRPPVEQDAPGWVGDLGAVPAGDQYVEVTVQGLGKETVVLQDMNVRVQGTDAPLDWNTYQMGSGCGAEASTRSFAVDLDEAAPRVTTTAGQRDFPYKVSESDREVFRVRASTKLHDVRWYLELEWSSGDRHSVLRVDDQGKPFRTSSKAGRPSYSWQGASTWEREGARDR